MAHGEIGEMVGRSGAMMNGYHNQPGKTARGRVVRRREGKRYIRTGDVGRFDEDGFLTLMDRKKDMIISGGFNIYPERPGGGAARAPGGAEAAVVGVPSDAWGETPVAFVVAEAGRDASRADELTRLGQRPGRQDPAPRPTCSCVDSLPRSHIGKVLKRELRDGYKGAAITA